MAQLRVTKKFATDLKLKELKEPSLVTAILDDWFIDVIRAHRKKVAMITHGESKLTYFAPYADVGGAKSIPGRIPVLINKFLYDNDYEKHEKDVATIFNQAPVFCKTVDRSVLSHMRNFKFAVEVYISHIHSENELDWDSIAGRIHDYIISINKRDYSTPIDIMKNILDK